MGWWVNALIDLSENVTIGKIGQWGNGKMGNWGYVYKKGMEAILNLKQEQVQACKH